MQTETPDHVWFRFGGTMKGGGWKISPSVLS
ncbi:hypothetical protein Poly59_55510 [Rubripirellula reticaptiva]|uniref:Uncharacterized protein n=1 Tax=Rubripirellula reticaptiva TaxID=2528013 RepID=A0A5C6ECG0_9BACT|nr:hypothetical protein Poly59_55510 [Rubripirellula reticaptiva]